MSAPARITQADVERATKVAMKAVEKTGRTARVVMDLRQVRIEIIIGEQGDKPLVGRGGWEDE
jgi:CMP-2-keto-3-deoxyoctulosonic acid synthetase